MAASIGFGPEVASFPADGTTLDNLFRLADEKMYTKKRNAIASRPV